MRPKKAFVDASPILDFWNKQNLGSGDSRRFLPLIVVRTVGVHDRQAGVMVDFINVVLDVQCWSASRTARRRGGGANVLWDDG